MKYLITLLLIVLSQLAYSQKDSLAGYPVNERTGKISFSKTVNLPLSKDKLFKRVEQFIISQNFDRDENIRCKDKSHVVLQLVDKPITYKDYEDGKYYGCGFFNFSYRDKERFAIVFNFKISVKEGAYKYEFTDFKVMEFVTAPRNKGKSKSMTTASNSMAFGSSSGFVEFSANDVRKWDIEDFVYMSAWDNGSSEVFDERVYRLISDLKATMKDDF